MNQTTIDRLKEYESLMLKKRALENEIDVLKSELLPELPRDKAIETENGTFNVESRMKWTYSESTQEADKDIKATKKSEEQDGTAEGVPGEAFLVYRENK